MEAAPEKSSQQAPAAPSPSTIAKKPTQQNLKTKPRAKAAKKNQTAGRKTPKRSEFTARKASFHLRSKQATTESPESLTFLTQLKAPRT
jgi:hypothetical protein